MFICYIYRHLCFDNVYMPIKNLKKELELEKCDSQMVSASYVTLKKKMLITYWYNVKNLQVFGIRYSNW